MAYVIQFVANVAAQLVSSLLCKWLGKRRKLND
jgi:hypothetical protein